MIRIVSVALVAEMSVRDARRRKSRRNKDVAGGCHSRSSRQRPFASLAPAAMCEIKNPSCDPAFAIRTNVSAGITVRVAPARSDTCFLASQVRRDLSESFDG
jgi:hypothetical protein